MTEQFFKSQMTRLQTRFGAKAIDAEFVMLVWREVRDMSETGFQRACDVWIGSRTHHKPPLLSEFREARIAEDKLRLHNDTQGAVSMLKRKAPREMQESLRKALAKDFGGVESVADALEIARLNHRMRDPKDSA